MKSYLRSTFRLCPGRSMYECLFASGGETHRGLKAKSQNFAKTWRKRLGPSILSFSYNWALQLSLVTPLMRSIQVVLPVTRTPLTALPRSPE